MKVTLVIRNPEVKELLKRLGRRKAILVENAIIHFLETENGKILYKTLAIQEEKINKTKANAKSIDISQRETATVSIITKDHSKEKSFASAKKLNKQKLDKQAYRKHKLEELASEDNKISIDKFFFNNSE